jgi:N-acetylmuramoyl-L-alanine amidase
MWIRSKPGLGMLLLFAVTTPMVHAAAPRRQAARADFERAQRLREALTGKPESKRSEKDYQRAIDAYRRVYYVDPASPMADDSVRAVAELLAEEGRTLDNASRSKAAIGQYEFLRREYPGSKFRVDALFTEAQIYHQDLHDETHAKTTFQEFLKRYPHSHLAEQAQQALEDIASAERDTKKKAKSAKAGNVGGRTVAGERELPQRALHARDSAANTGTAVAKSGGTPAGTAGEDVDAKNASDTKTTATKDHGRVLVTGIRHWSTPDYTRVAIDLEDELKYEAGRVPSPDRIFFDLHGAKLASELVGKTFDVSDGFLQKIRVAPYKGDTVRIVLNVDDVSDYSAFLLPNPYRLIIDIHGNHPSTQVAKNLESSPIGKEKPTFSAPVIPPKPDAQDAESSASEIAKLTQSGGQKATQKPTSNPVVAKVAPRSTDTMPRTQRPTVMMEAPDRAQPTPGAQAKANVQAPTKISDLDNDTSTGIRAKSRTRKDTQPEESAAIHVAEPTADGARSLTRTLGLKIGRIVVDAGHGGHDTGTIGPNGLLEKDLVLDVAMRLGKLLQRNLESEVIYTREDDTFVPLETRTAIANKVQADLFISVHANSSRDSAARGIETYYLNFTSNADALDVAARENAVSEKSIHELQDLVKKIALKDKIEESREFAADVESSMHDSLVLKNPGLKDRGVKKAPFIVLIGANMPSILSEISFVSNPEDEKKLRTPEYRQKIAEALYKGVAKYVGGLSGVKVAAKSQSASGQ